MKENLYQFAMSLKKAQIIELGIIFGVYANSQRNREALMKSHTKDQLAWHVAHNINLYIDKGILKEEIAAMREYEIRLTQAGLI